MNVKIYWISWIYCPNCLSVCIVINSKIFFTVHIIVILSFTITVPCFWVSFCIANLIKYMINYAFSFLLSYVIMKNRFLNENYNVRFVISCSKMKTKNLRFLKFIVKQNSVLQLSSANNAKLFKIRQLLLNFAED